MNTKFSLSFNYKIQLILLFFITLIVGITFGDFKTGLGKDERTYISNGLNLINHGFENTKILPLMSIIFYFFSQIFLDSLTGVKLMYVLSLIGIVFSQFYFAIKLGEANLPIIPSFITLILPGMLVLNLYGIANLFSTSLLMLSLVLISLNLKYKSILLTASIGIIFSILYQCRLEFLFIFLIILLVWPFINNYKKFEVKLILRDFCILVLSFLIILLPWQLHLYENGLIFSRIASGKGWNSIYHLILNDEATFISNITLNFKQIIIILTNNSFEHLKNLGSPKLLPILFMPLVGIGFMMIKKCKFLILYISPLIIFFPILCYHHPDFDMVRMFTPFIPFYGMCIGMFICKDFNMNGNYFLAKFCIVSILIFLFSIFFLIFGNKTYKLYILM